MKAYLLEEFGADLVERELDDPVPVGTEVGVRVLSSGLCHGRLIIPPWEAARSPTTVWRNAASSSRLSPARRRCGSYLTIVKVSIRGWECCPAVLVAAMVSV